MTGRSRITIKDADQIVVLNNGRVMGKGKHLELLNTCPVYQEIVKSQLSEQEYADELKLAKKVTKSKSAGKVANV